MNGVEVVNQSGSVDELVGRLLDPGRETPAVVITSPSGGSEPYVDTTHLVRQLPRSVPAFLVPTGRLTRRLADGLPDRAAVYGGAGRVYPILGLDTGIRPCPVRFAYGPHQGLAAARALVDDARTCLSTARRHQHTADQHERLTTAEQHLRELRIEADRLRRQLRHTQQQPNDDDEVLFTDPGEQFRHDVYLAWVRRIPAGQKTDLPLQPWTVGPLFLESLHSSGADYGKVVDVTVEIATGLVDQINGRNLHQLRDGPAGAPAFTRSDGAVCWRAAVQANSPAARRIHFWRTRTGVELSRVVIHDDLTP